MKKVLVLLIATICVGIANADDDYSDMVYTATSFMYWCKYKEIPKSVNDFAKVTDINDPDPKLTLTPEEWFKAVHFEVEGDNLKIIHKSEESLSTSVSNCESHKNSY